MRDHEHDTSPQPEIAPTRDAVPGASLAPASASHVLSLQRSAGNQAVVEALKRGLGGPAAPATHPAGSALLQRTPADQIRQSLDAPGDVNAPDHFTAALGMLNGMSMTGMLQTLAELKQGGYVDRLSSPASLSAASQSFDRPRLQFALDVVRTNQIPTPVPQFLVDHFDQYEEASRFLGLPARPRPADESACLTIADTIKNEFMDAARDGSMRAKDAVASGFDYTAWSSNLIGNTIWAATCLIPQTAGPRVIFAVSMLGVSVAAAGGLPKDGVEFGTFLDANLTTLQNRLNDQRGSAAGAAWRFAQENNWDDNQTRLEMYRSLLAPQFIRLSPDGTPAINREAVEAKVESELMIKAGQTPLSGQSQAIIRVGETNMSEAARIEQMLRDVGKIEYKYRVPSMTRNAGGFTGFFGARDAITPSVWGFELQSVKMNVRTEVANELNRLLPQVYGNGPVPIAELKTPKLIHLENGEDMMDSAVPQIEINAENAITKVMVGGRYREWMEEQHISDIQYGQQIIDQAWRGSGGRPPAAQLSVVGM
jgi:hypothetical protein